MRFAKTEIERRRSFGSLQPGDVFYSSGAESFFVKTDHVFKDRANLERNAVDLSNGDFWYFEADDLLYYCPEAELRHTLSPLPER